VNQENERASETFSNVQSMFEGANATLRHVIEEGHVGSTIVNIGSKEDVDLIIIGARGHSQISRILLGSVSDHVATHASSSVLVVRPTGLGESDRSIRIAVAFEVCRLSGEPRVTRRCRRKRLIHALPACQTRT